MTYQYVDDQMHCHRKIVKAGNEATGAWLRIANWCAAHLTDGKVEHEVALMFAKRETVLDRLVTVGLLDRDGPDFSVHDYLEWNPTASEVGRHKEKVRTSRVAAGLASADKRWGGCNKTSNKLVTNDQQSCNPPPPPPPPPPHDKKKKTAQAQRPEGVTTQTWEDFLSHRKDCKSPVTETVINAFSREAEKAGLSLEEALATCMLHGWRGFSAEWLLNRGKGKNPQPQPHQDEPEWLRAGRTT